MSLAKLAGVAIDARVVTRRRDRAQAARWIARGGELDRMRATLAKGRPPLEAASLPWSWRTFLRVVRMPLA